jgi:hypothetical protein
MFLESFYRWQAQSYAVYYALINDFMKPRIEEVSWKLEPTTDVAGLTFCFSKMTKHFWLDIPSFIN